MRQVVRARAPGRSEADHAPASVGPPKIMTSERCSSAPMNGNRSHMDEALGIDRMRLPTQFVRWLLQRIIRKRGLLFASDRTVSVTASGYDSQNASASVTESATSTVDFTLSETATGGSGSIKGTVYSSSGGKLSGVTLSVLGGTSSLTNRGGKYTIQNVPAGLQTVTASKAGYTSLEQDVDVLAGGTVNLNFTLSPN